MSRDHYTARRYTPSGAILGLTVSIQRDGEAAVATVDFSTPSQYLKTRLTPHGVEVLRDLLTEVLEDWQ